MTKLYTVRVSYDYVVLADSVNDAYAVGQSYIKEALSDMPIHDVDVDIIEGVSAYGWDNECIPYGGDGNTRTGEYLKEQVK
jgi:hypothetical protein